MPPCWLHHSIMASIASPTSSLRPGAAAKPRSSPYPTWIVVAVTPWPGALFAAPGPHGDGRSPNVAAEVVLGLPPPVSVLSDRLEPHPAAAKARARTIPPTCTVLL